MRKTASFIIILAIVTVGASTGLAVGKLGQSSKKHSQQRSPASTTSAAPQTPSTARAKPEQFEFKKRSEAFAKTFSENEAGKALRLALTLLPYRSVKNEEGEKFEQALATARERPLEAIQEISNGLKQIPAAAFRERQYLIQFASRLDVDKETKLELLSRELVTTTASEDGGSFFTPAIALDSMIEVSGNANSLEAKLRTVLQNTKSRESARLLLSRYSAAAPESAERLKKEFGI
jgi:hypothetical protein